jgi:predicted PurR-regulated permease PerM
MLLILERLVSTEDSYRNEQERYRSLTSEYELIHEQLIQLKLRVNKEKNDKNNLVEEQQNELVHLSKSILSKQTEHDQLLSVYICFFLSCYLLIFFLFFFLLQW